MEFHLYLQAIEILRNMQGTIKLKVRKNSSEKKLSFSTTNHLDPEPGTKSVFQLQSAPGIYLVQLWIQIFLRCCWIIRIHRGSIFTNFLGIPCLCNIPNKLWNTVFLHIQKNMQNKILTNLKKLTIHENWSLQILWIPKWTMIFPVTW